jgi:general secretion pathway protein D
MLLAGLLLGSSALADDSATNAPAQEPPVAPVTNNAPAAATETAPPDAASKTNAPATPVAAKANDAEAPNIEPPTNNAPSSTVILPNGEVGLRLNFRGAPLEMVLNYLSEAAGFIIVLDTQVKGKVDVWSNTPLSKDEAIDLLNSVLNKNGYAAIRNGRTLTIVNKDEAKARDIPVRTGSDPEGIPRNDQIVTQILPVRFVEATQLIKDLQPLVSSQTTMTANEAGNAIVITDTQANIRRVAEVIKAIDTGAEDVTEVRVFHLRYADPNEMAELLGNVFPDDTRSGTSQSPVQFGGGPFGGGGFRNFFGGGGGNNNRGGASTGSTNQRIKKRAKVIAVADPRTSSVIVSATKDLIDQIAGMVEQLDANPARKQHVYVYSLDNADVTEVQTVLEDMFERNSTTASRNNRSSGNQNNALQNRANQNQNSTGTGTGTSGFGNRGVGSGGGGGGGF